jgi:hypothetical protein
MVSTQSVRRLGATQIEDVSSHFLQHGWRDQRYELDDVQIAPARISAKLTVHRPELSPGDDPSFYLSSTVTLPCVFQLAIIHAVTQLGMKKNFPVWSREFHLDNHRRVRKNAEIPITLLCYEAFQAEALASETRPHSYARQNFRYTFSIDNDGFTGKAWIVFRPTLPDAPESGCFLFRPGPGSVR